MLNIFSYSYLPTVFLLWQGICSGLLPIFQLGCPFLIAAFSFIFMKYLYLFIWLHQVFVAVCWISGCSTELLLVACGIQFPDQGLNPDPLCWEHGVSHWTTSSVQFSSVAQSCLLCHPMDCSMPGLPVHHQLSTCSNSCTLSW